jgi:hypothetical protein
MQLSPETSKALDAWLGPETWDSVPKHHYDMERFYRFVDQYQKDHGFSLDEDALRTEIKSRVKAKGRAFGNHQEELVEELINWAYAILDFLKVTRR